MSMFCVQSYSLTTKWSTVKYNMALWASIQSRGVDSYPHKPTIYHKFLPFVDNGETIVWHHSSLVQDILVKQAICVNCVTRVFLLLKMIALQNIYKVSS